MDAEKYFAVLRINPTEDIKGIFKAHMMAAVDALRHLTQFTEVHIDSPEKAQSALLKWSVREFSN